MHRHGRRSRWMRRRRWRWGRRRRVHRYWCRRRRMESRWWRWRRRWRRMHRGRRRCRRKGIARRRRRWWRRLYGARLRLTAGRRQRSWFHRCRSRTVLWRWRRTRFHEGIRRRWWWRRRPARSGTRRRRQRRQGRGAARCRTESCSRRCAGRRRVRHRGRQRDALLPSFGSCAGRSRWWPAEFDAARRPHESGHGGTDGNRQEEACARRRWRRQRCEFARPQRQEEQRRPRWRRVARPGKYDDRLIDIAELVRRRRRYAKIVIGEIGRRVVGRGEHRQTPSRIPDMGPVRIAAQIRPIGRRRVGDHGAAPNDRLAAHRQHSGDALGVRAVRINGEELLVAVDSVAIERCGAGVVDARKIADRFGPDIGDRHDVGRRRCAGGELGHQEWAVDLRSVPGNFGALGEIADA